MTNLTDITDLTDNALDAVIAARTNDVVIVEHLTITERAQVATALGFTAPAHWLLDAPADADNNPGGVDYELAILARQEVDFS